MEEQLRYFAYGSNLLLERLRTRTPSAVLLGPAQLNGYRLDFSVCGDDGSGKCAITPTTETGAKIWGAVYLIANAELPLLDAAEGVPHLYRRAPVTVHCCGTVMEVQTYLPAEPGKVRPPYAWYWQLVVAGALQQGLPPEHVLGLIRQDLMVDPQACRPARLAALDQLQQTHSRLVRGYCPCPECLDVWEERGA